MGGRVDTIVHQTPDFRVYIDIVDTFSLGESIEGRISIISPISVMSLLGGHIRSPEGSGVDAPAHNIIDIRSHFFLIDSLSLIKSGGMSTRTRAVRKIGLILINSGCQSRADHRVHKCLNIFVHTSFSDISVLRE